MAQIQYIKDLFENEDLSLREISRRTNHSFNTVKPFLETHHVIWLADGGDDSIENTVALCPNCHKKMHVLNLDEDVDKLLRIAATY